MISELPQLLDRKPKPPMSSLIFFAGAFFTASIACAVCYGVALRDCRQSQELGYELTSPICIGASNEAARFLAVGTMAYLLGGAALSFILWPA
jgi:hypothetical protein